MKLAPLAMQWNGTGFDALPRSAKAADERFTIGETYLVDAEEARSEVSHRHYFAAIREAWLNLPEDIAERFPTQEHLRKYALVKAGYRDERSVVCASKAEAQRFAAFIRPMDDYAVVIASEAVVTVLTAKSQSTRAMGAATFQASKTAVLDAISDMIGVSTRALEDAAA